MITGVHLDQIGFDPTDEDECDLVLIDVVTDNHVTYSVEAIFTVHPGHWNLAWAGVNAFILGIKETVFEINVELEDLGEEGQQFIQEMLDAPVLSWVWN